VNTTQFTSREFEARGALFVAQARGHLAFREVVALENDGGGNVHRLLLQLGADA
jgi:hypothetical protein